ncbi:MAG TPA: hypothetical protein VG710_07545 [Opitutus sp.]|nr:hypothetical protein [Opitutus sp.]
MNEETNETAPAATPVPENWTRLGKEHLPPATFWPAGFALGITFVFWGLITSWVVLVVGLVMFAGCLAGWISELRHERKVHF